MGAEWEGGQAQEDEEAKKKGKMMATNLRMWQGVDLEGLKHRERFEGSKLGGAYTLDE